MVISGKIEVWKIYRYTGNIVIGNSVSSGLTANWWINNIPHGFLQNNPVKYVMWDPVRRI
jgi:hypothetical protein